MRKKILEPFNPKKSVTHLNKHAVRIASLVKARETKAVIAQKRAAQKVRRAKIFKAQVVFATAILIIMFAVVIKPEVIAFANYVSQTTTNTVNSVSQALGIKPQPLLSAVVLTEEVRAEAMPTATPSATPEATTEPAGNTKGGVISKNDVNEFQNSFEEYILTGRYADIIYKQWILESSKGSKGVAVKCRSMNKYNDFGYAIKQNGDVFCFDTFEKSVDAMIKWWDTEYIGTVERTLCKYNQGQNSVYAKSESKCRELKYVQDFNALTSPVTSARD